MSEENVNIVKNAAMLHDIGMVGINSSVLKKKGKLTEQEYGTIKRHSNIGVKIVERTNLFEQELPLILHHHERYDGSGYPHKLKGDIIPYGARVIAIAEAYDVMMSNTLYKKANSVEHAIEELKECAGTQFDPGMVKAFVRSIRKEQ